MLYACLSILISLALAQKFLPENHYLLGFNNQTESVSLRTQFLETRACTINTAKDRACWSGTYGVQTDFDLQWPTTGVTRYYELVVRNTTCNPDGHGKRICFLFNGQFPGPTITANWGDWIQVTVLNMLANNGTGIHWHGLRQLDSNGMDGVGGITECPIAPLTSTTYRFQATQYGTSWYHSHYAAQYCEGLSGPIVINGPASANYDVDGGPLSVSDWQYKTAFQVDSIDATGLPTPIAGDQILINGKNKYNLTVGSYSVITVKPRLKTRLRLINTSNDNAIRVSIDNHSLEVITSDFVPIRPINASSILIGVGQRYDVILTANKKSGNYWIRGTAESACASLNNGAGLAVLNYAGKSTHVLPITTSSVVSNGCNPPGDLVPYVQNTVGSSAAFISQAEDLEVNLLIPGVTVPTGNIVTWGINSSALQISWDTPTLTYVMTGNTSYPSTENLISIPNDGVWSFWIIQETGGANTIALVPHPIHLHGHDFYVLGSGTGVFDMVADPPLLTYDNPTRRDTTYLPEGGWLALAFPADNPGAWLMHCHISSHISRGLGVQFLEASNKIVLPSAAKYNSQCEAFDKYYASSIYKQAGSGL